MYSSNSQPQIVLTYQNAKHLIIKAQEAINNSKQILEEARQITDAAGLSIDSSILDASYYSCFLPSKFCHGVNQDDTNTSKKREYFNSIDTHRFPKRTLFSSFRSFILSTTGGYSNTDHIIKYTGDDRMDKIAHYKRLYKRRAKSIQPEQRGEDRWDQPRVLGSRRRRIMRERDLPSAPPEPPKSGYIVFIGQMTVKYRHDHPNMRHCQVNVVRDISKIWKYHLSKKERKYYSDFVMEVGEEYHYQHREYRATGIFQPSKKFERLEKIGPWVRKEKEKRNKLEHEICAYDTVIFPLRPNSVEKPQWEKEREEQKMRAMKRKQVGKNRNTEEK